ncbi:MAG: SOS response-associated peptidase [Thermomicrobiales bacterium]
MCGRLVRDETDEIAREYFTEGQLALYFEQIEPGFNLAPGQALSVIVENRHGERELRKMHWGLRRPWSRLDSRAPSNARAETILALPTFRDLVARKRCLVPMTGYYEWQQRGGRKIPYFITTDRPLCCFAGIYDAWLLPDGEIAASYAIITTTPAESIAHIHDRMPVILRPEDEDRWLSRSVRDARAMVDLLKPYPSDRLKSWRVSTRVNDLRNTGPDLILPVEGDSGQPEWVMEPLFLG